MRELESNEGQVIILSRRDYKTGQLNNIKNRLFLGDYKAISQIIQSIKSNPQIKLIDKQLQQRNSQLSFKMDQEVDQSQTVVHRQKEKKIGNYLIKQTLGKGTFGKVKLATHIPTGEKVAIKILEKDKIIDVADVERVTREIHILKLIRHPNIIQLYEIIESPKYLFLVMEFLCQGQLFDYIVKKKRMDQDEACKVFDQIISGIEYCHKLKIVHRDLKLENILIDYDQTIRIVDFGLSNTYKCNEKLKTACGSPCYAAPEMIDGKQPYEPIMVDIWSAGIILYAMVCGFLPFEDPDTRKLYQKILSGEYSVPTHLSSDLKDFLKKVLTVDPKKRIRPAEMKMHPWWRKHGLNHHPQGLVVGYHKIPVDYNILKEVKTLTLDMEACQQSLEANRHNNLTTTYYLLMKRFLRNGGFSKADPRCKQFDKTAIEPNQRQPRNNSLKPSDLIKITESPQAQKRSKSYYLGVKSKKHQIDRQINNFTNTSINNEKRKRSKSKLKNKSLSQYNTTTHNNTIVERMNKSFKQAEKVERKSVMTRSNSKKKKSPRKTDVVFSENENLRPRAMSQKAKLNAKKSHQHSYMIGVDSGHDWPLQPKYKAENGGKIRNALRKR